MARPRKQTYTMEMYLKKIQTGKIRNDADVQRKFAWGNEHINELIVTVLTDDYIPPIILGEDANTQLHIVDGGCRSAALNKFRYGNYKITSAIENPVIVYQRKFVDDDGNERWEEETFNIKGKTYEKLPEELKDKFDEYQIETVIHESCDSFIISKYIKRYNNHVAMNTDQKAFTYLEKFAGNVHKVLESKFFNENCVFTNKDKDKGVVERFIVESMMCMNHFDHWRKKVNDNFRYLNENATDAEFNVFSDNLHRLESIITDDIKDIFNKKDSFLFVSLFDKFVDFGMEDEKFAEFLREFKNNIRAERKNAKGLIFDEIDKGVGTKDKAVITDKLVMLEVLMREFLHVDECNEQECLPTHEEFIAKTLRMDKEEIKAEMSFYNESLDLLLETSVKIDSKLRNDDNRLSLLAMMAYSYKEDMDLDEWMADYASKNHTYCEDQRKNFRWMKRDFEKYAQKNKNAA